jgi:phosphoglycolate phosphatase-like HAD superfamily hydrolase
MMKYDVIVDIDGTIADNSHRTHHIHNKPKNWMAYQDGILDDEPFHDILFIVKALKAAGSRIVLCSGRNEHERTNTNRWLLKHDIAKLFDNLYMRKNNDYRSDDIIKKELLVQIRADGYDPKIVIDDRLSVTKMWREEGLRCLQVNWGDF